MYNPTIVEPMRKELTDAGFTELTSAAAVDDFFKNGSSGTALLVINSVCGCAAGAARPGARLAVTGEKRPEKLVTVFAGQDAEATNQARSYLVGFPPSSPSMAILKDGEVVKMISRHEIEGHTAEQIAESLKHAFTELC